MAGTLQRKQDEGNSIGRLLQSDSMQAQLKLALPRTCTPERLARLVLTQIRTTPKLLDCTRESLLGAIMQVAQLGLEPGVQGQAWLIPYGKECTLVVGYRGLAQLAWRSGLVKSINARAVYAKDEYDYDFGTDEIHHRAHSDPTSDALTHAYTIIHTTNGGRLWDCMSRVELDAIRKRARAGNNGPWVTDFSEMCKKTVLRRLFKTAPMSADLQTAMTLEDAADAGHSQGLDFEIPIDVEPTPEPDEKK